MSPSKPANRRTPGTSSARKLITTVLTFTAEHPTPTINELAARVEVPVSTMYRYISLLRETGLVEPIGDGRFRLTDAVVGLNAAADAGRTTLLEAASNELVSLRDLIDETVLIARRGGENAYCVAREESSHPVRLQFAVGQAMPLHSGSVARVLLASRPTRERLAYLEARRDEIAVDRLDLLTPTALDDVRRATWTQSYEEVDAGIWGCAAAIEVNGHVVAALGTAGPIHRLDDKRRATVIKQVRASAQAISAAMTHISD